MGRCVLNGIAPIIFHYCRFIPYAVAPQQCHDMLQPANDKVKLYV